MNILPPAPRPVYRAPIKLILGMEGVSSLVNQLFQVLLPWYILASTGSIMWMGVTAFATIAPGIFSALWGGRVIDRLGRSATMLVCEMSQFLIILSIPLLIITGNARPAYIAGLVFLSAFFDAPGMMAREALMPLYSRWAAVPLHRTLGLKEAVDGFTAVAGPLLGGVIIALWGTLNAWLAAAAMCFIIVLIAVFFYNKRRPRAQPNISTYKDVLAAVRADKFLLSVIVFTMPLFILGESWELLILPAYVHNFGHGSVYLGVLEAAFGLGAFTGAVYFAARSKRLNFFTILIINYCAYILSILVLMYNLPRGLVVAATLISGLPFGAFAATVTTIILSRAAEELRGKTLGLFTAAAALVESIFILLIAFALEKAGLFAALCGAAFIFALLMFISLFARRHYKNPPPA